MASVPHSEYDEHTGFGPRPNSVGSMPKSSPYGNQEDLPSAADWQQHRGTITFLYIEKNLKLTDLQKRMETEHGFKATSRMYKTRFEQWGLHKNINSKLKATVLKTSGATKTHALSYSCRIRLSRMSTAAAAAAAPSRLPKHALTRTMCSNTDDQHVEAVLQQLKVYYSGSSNFAAISLPDTQSYTSDDLITACKAPNFNTSLLFKSLKSADVWSLCNSSLIHLQKGDYSAATIVIGQVCDRMKEVLQGHPQDFFRKIFMILGARQWSRFEAYRQSLLKFVAHVANLVLVSNHPLSIALSHLQHAECLERSAEPSLRFLTENLPERFGHDHQEMLLLQDSHAVILIRQQNYEQAERVLIDAIAQSGLYRGPSHEDTRVFMRRLANMYMHQERWDRAEQICEEILRRDKLAAGIEIADGSSQCENTDGAKQSALLRESSIRTMQDLSFLARQRDDTEKSGYWLQEAARAVLRLFTLDQLESMLIVRGCCTLLDRQDPVGCARKVLDCCSTIWCSGDQRPD